MDSELLRPITGLAARLRRQQASLVRAMARARQIGDGTDESGCITIVVDDDGTAQDVRVAPDWRRRLRPAQLGAAVVAADGEVARRRASATAEALAAEFGPAAAEFGPAAAEFGPAAGEAPDEEGDPPIPERLASTQDGADGLGDLGGLASLGGVGWLMPVAPPQAASDPTLPRRSLAEISTAVLAAFEDLERFSEPPPPVHGTGGQGAVRVTLSSGRITECVINQAWLANQDEVTLAHALREAVSAAAVAHVAARQPFIEYQQRLASIVDDARSNLSHGAQP